MRIVDRLDAGDRAQVGGDLSDVGCCRAPEVTPRPSELAGVARRPNSADIVTAVSRNDEVVMRCWNQGGDPSFR